MRRAAILAVALTALVLVGLRVGVVEPVKITGISMSPTLVKGDVVVVNRLDRNPERGDLIKLRSPQNGERMVKRVVGVGGDIVDIRDAILFVNDVEAKEPFVDHKSIDALYYGPVVVSAGSVLVMGDNRDGSIDSRAFGEVSLDKVTGTVLGRLWPLGAISNSG